MIDYQKQIDKENQNPLNQRCLTLLKQAKVEPDPSILHSLNLMLWTIQSNPEKEWDRMQPIPILNYEIEETIYLAMGADPQVAQEQILEYLENQEDEVRENPARMNLMQMQNYLIYNLIENRRRLEAE